MSVRQLCAKLALPIALSLSLPLIAVDAAQAQCTTPASGVDFGVGMAPPRTSSPFRLTTLIPPRLGKTADIGMSMILGLPPGPAPFAMLVGTKRASIPFLGGHLYVDPTTVVATLTGNLDYRFFHGYFWAKEILIPIPNNTALCGVTGVFQAAVLHNTSKALFLSNGVEWRVGS